MSACAQAVELFEDATGDIALGDLEAAIGKYRQCVALDPQYFDAWHALGMAGMKAVGSGTGTLATRNPTVLYSLVGGSSKS